MKKHIPLLALLLLIISISACRKHDTYKKYPNPDWTEDNTGKYPVSMTAVVQLTEELQPYLLPTDKMAAFIKGECRGVGVLVKVNADTSVFYVLIHGTADEQEKISFKYYSGRTSYIYTTDDFLTFQVDSNYGTADDPKMLFLRATK